MMPDPCDTCDGTGWKIVPYGTTQRAEHCDQCDYWARKRGEAPGVPADLRMVRLATYSTKPGGMKLTTANAAALDHAQLFVDDTHPGLFVYGGVGTGKTTLACAILNDLWAAGQRVRFVRVPELLTRLLPGFEEGSDLWHQVVGVPVLCLDDAGASQGTDFARRMLQVIYDARSDRAHRTLWTSNLTLDELANFLGDQRLPSRIAGQAKIVELNGPDYRLRQRRKAAK